MQTEPVVSWNPMRTLGSRLSQSRQMDLESHQLGPRGRAFLASWCPDRKLLQHSHGDADDERPADEGPEQQACQVHAMLT